MTLEFAVAGIGSRFVALLLDHLIQLGVVILMVGLLALISAAGGDRFLDSISGKWFTAGLILLFFLLFWGYFALFEAFWHGQTPGKRVLKLRVIKDAGRQVTLFESLARNLLRVADFFPSFYVTGVITMLCNQRNKRLGDLAAGTIVVHERGEAQPLLYTGGVVPVAPRIGTLFSPGSFSRAEFPVVDAWRVPAGTEAMFPADAVARLSAHDLVVIDAFFARALDLPLETRAAMAHRIVAELVAKMGVAVPEGNPERAMEAMAVGLRGQGRRY